MPESTFTVHTLDSAPPAARRMMQSTVDHLGYLPEAVGLMAESPQMFEGFLKTNTLFEAATLDPLAREVLVLTVATRNGCHICVAMHTARLVALGASEETIQALRERRPLDDPRLDAVRIFTLEVIDRTGDVEDKALQAFLSHGYTHQNALEVVLGIGAYTISTLANRLTRAPLDESLAAYAWSEHGD
jgi:AhpD family alkylhydroperoxidase